MARMRLVRGGRACEVEGNSLLRDTHFLCRRIPISIVIIQSLLFTLTNALILRHEPLIA